MLRHACSRDNWGRSRSANKIGRIQFGDVLVSRDKVTFLIHKSKMDTEEKGAWVVLFTMNNRCCPVALVRQFLKYSKISGRDIVISSREWKTKSDKHRQWISS
ncbi:hypothetical protein FKM82_011898 [Ascaphus truei]